MRQLVSLIALGGILVAACGDPPPSKYPTQPAFEGDNTLGPGDVFEIRVFPRPELGGEFTVNADGSISFPLLGSVVVAGKAPAQVEIDLRDQLADGYLKNPTVTVVVKEYRSKKVSVLGEVRNPGTLPFVDGMTIVEAVARAGGFTAMARKNAVTVTRQNDGKKVTYTVPVESISKGSAPDFPMRPGDVVLVPERPW